MFGSSLEDTSRGPLDESGSISDPMICPVCNLPFESGVLFCARCGTPLSDASRTIPVGMPKEIDDRQNGPRGGAFVTDIRAVILEIEGTKLTLPIIPSLIVGRVSTSEDAEQPDIDLSSFEARRKGVSRRHIAITRKRNLVYVVDLGSTNGTWLNGVRLYSNTERLLRSGDEIDVGQLRIVVRF